MRQIQPIEVYWGTQLAYTLNALTVRIIADDLQSVCALYFSIIDTDGKMQKEGNYAIQGEDYTNWDGSNDYPFQFVAAAENLTLL